MTDAEPNSLPETDTLSVSRGALIYATTLIAFASGFNYLDRAGLAILITPSDRPRGWAHTAPPLFPLALCCHPVARARPDAASGGS